MSDALLPKIPEIRPMCAMAHPPGLSPDTVSTSSDERGFELINGRLVEKNMGALSGWIAGEILAILRDYSRARRLGWIFPSEVGYQCFPNAPKTVRKPDVSFIRPGRLPAERPPDGWINVAPDLVVEVVSPNDPAYELDEKIEDYLKVGIPLIWVVYPNTRTVYVWRVDGTGLRLREGDELSGAEVIPGFRCPVASIFPAPNPTASEAPG